jgi:hypothetical protein
MLCVYVENVSNKNCKSVKILSVIYLCIILWNAPLFLITPSTGASVATVKPSVVRQYEGLIAPPN